MHASKILVGNATVILMALTNDEARELEELLDRDHNYATDIGRITSNALYDALEG
jgi:hypothetical protein